MQRSKKGLLESCYWDEQRTRCKILIVITAFLWAVLCFVVGYSIK
jgi:hypothetical protein